MKKADEPRLRVLRPEDPEEDFRDGGEEVGAYEDAKDGGDEELEERIADLLEQASSASSVKKRQECARAVLELDPRNLPAKLLLVMDSKDLLKMLEVFDEAVQEEEDGLRKEGWFADEYIGEFWGIYETRNYMFARFSRMKHLIMMSRYRKAIEEGKDMLRLCQGDNLGVRYLLMGLYVMLEEKEALEKLFEEYEEEGPETLLSGAMMAYRFGETDKALSYLQQIRIPNFRPFLRAVLRGEEEETYWEEAMENRRMGGYQYNTVGHLLHIVDEWDFLKPHSVPFLQWAYEAVKRPVRRKS